jgi:hypothetical protein
MATKLTTVIVNNSGTGLIMKVGNHHHFARLASVKQGGEFKMQVDLNWTYQEFLLEDAADAAKKLTVNSDDCCDFKRITVTEVDGKLDVVRVPRHQQSADAALAVAEAEKASRPLNVIHSLLANSSWKIW